MTMKQRIGGRAIRAAGAAVLALFTCIALAGPAAGQAKTHIKAKKKTVSIRKINLNTATEAQLTEIKGLNLDLAKRILGARPYRKIEELSKAGLDLPAIDAVRPFVTVGGWGGNYRQPAYRLKPGERVNLNTADRKVIEALPGIGRGLATAIIENRPYTKPEDIMKVRGIKAKTFARIKNLIFV